jgi:hypothetical protein
VILAIKNFFSIVNLLIRWLFQSEAPGDGDDTVVVAGAKGEASKIEEITECQIQGENPQKVAEADADAERAEV